MYLLTGRIPIFCLLLYMHGMFAAARDNLRLPEVRTLGMGGNGAALSVFFNPALLALKERKEIYAGYYNRYSVKELASVGSGLTFPNRILPFGLHIASFGYDEYRESMFRFSVGKSLNEIWALGVSVQYALLQSALFETDAARLSADVGVTCRPAENWLLTLAAINMPSVTLHSEEVNSERIASHLAELGIGWQINDDLLICGGMAYSKNTPFETSLGMEYCPLADFHLRTGLRTAPLRPSLGAGYGFAGWMMDVVMIYHPVLGVSTGLSVSFAF